MNRFFIEIEVLFVLKAISKTLDNVLLKEHSQIIVILNGAKRSEESMTTPRLESTKLSCHGCFATLSMTFTAAFYMETIFEMTSS
jgi:hypothetical protein